jgi:PAS domain S-box-containing protein
MLADGGAVLGHVAALDDVTERKQAEGALADARRESEEHLQEWAASEKKAEEALRAARQAAEEAARQARGQLDERETALRRAEEALQAAQAEAGQKLTEEAERRRQAEEALQAARAELAAARQAAEEGENAVAESASARQAAEEELGRLRDDVRRLTAERGADPDEVRAATQGLRDAWREEVEAVAAMHLDARARLAEELAGHRETLQATRDAHDRLQTALAEKDGTAAGLRDELARLGEEAGATREAHDRLQALLAEKGGSEEALRRELDRLAEDAAALRQSHDRLQALLTQTDGNEEALRQELARHEREGTEARDARDRLRAELSQKAEAEAALRRELERLQGEAEARRQAEESHDRTRAALGDKERREEELRAELERLQRDLGERRQAEERTRREKEFLEGVIDGSPAGIFAHDRDGRCRVWNPALERLLGRSRADALGRAAVELFPPATPGDRPAPASENGSDGADLPVVSVIGRSDLLESAHAPVRDPDGEVVGGMALVRVLPAPALGENGTARPAGHGAPVRLSDIDWLAFN